MSSQDKEVDDNLFIWFMDKFNKHRISVHAAHVTFFMLVSFFPFMMFFVTLLKYTPVSLENILSLSKRVIPAGLQPVLFSWLKEKVGGFFGGIVNGIKDSLGIHSPSKVFAGIGKFMASGIGVGFDDQMSKVAGSIQAAVPAPMQSSVLTGGNVQAPAPSSMFGGGVDVHIANFNNYDTGKDIKTLTDTIMVQMEKSMSRKRVAVG